VISLIPSILSWSRRHRAVVVLGTLCLAGAAVVGMLGLRFDTDVLGLLPREGRIVPAFRTYVEAFGSVDDLYVVLTAPPGRQIRDYAADVEAWADRLRQLPGITRVDTGLVDPSRDLTWFADRRLLLLSPEGGRLERALDRFHGDALRESLRQRRALLTVPSPAVVQMIRYDPLGLFDLLRDELGTSQAGVNLGATEGGYVSADGRSRLLIAKPSQAPFDADFSRRLTTGLESLARALRSAQREGGDDERPPMQVRFAGGHRIAVETESVIRRESILNTAGSLALILPLLYLVFRSPWLVFVGSLPSAVSLLLVLGMLGAAGTTLSAAATASSAMLFGLGVDGVVLLYVAYTHAVRSGTEPAAAIDGLSGPAASMLLGMWTTAATFYGLKFVDFPSLEQLGTLIGHSMVLCGILTLVLVPALLPLRRRSTTAAPAKRARALSMPRFASWIDRRRRGILWAAAAVTLLMAVAASGLRINPTLERLRAVTPGAAFLQQIGPMFGLPDDVYVIVASGTDLESMLGTNERVRAALVAALPGMALQAPSTLLPSESTQRARQERIRTGTGDAATVGASLAEAERTEGFRPGSFDPFRERVPSMLAPELRLTYDSFRSHGLSDVIGRFIVRRDDRWLLATYAFPTRPEDVATLERTVAAADPTAILTGLPLVNRELGERFLPEFVKGLSIGTLIVVALVLAAFRDWRLSLLALAPTAIGLVWAAGALAIGAATLDLFALFAVVTFVGIGVDYGVHMVHRYQERGDAALAVAELAPVILVAAVITLLGYGTLVTSSYPPLRSIGLVSAVSIATLAAASLFVLPAILSARGSRR
jgi:predicted RND superfamily exporter protein